MKNYLMIVVFLLASACKQPQSKNNLKTLDNVANNNNGVMSLNSCGADLKSESEASVDVKTFENAFLKFENEPATGVKESEARLAVLSVLQKAPPGLISFFLRDEIKNSGFKIIVDLNAKECSLEGEDDENAKLVKSFMPKPSICRSKDVLKFTAGSYKKAPDGEVTDITVVQAIKHGLLYELVFKHLIIMRANTQLAPVLNKAREEYISALQKDGFNINVGENLSDEEKKNQTDSLIANSFDSYYCSSQSRELLSKNWCNVYNGFLNDKDQIVCSEKPNAQ